MATTKLPLRILGLKRTKSDQEVYSFGVCCVAGLLFNGFIYNRTSGSIKGPSINMGGNYYPLVKGFGVHWVRLKNMVEEMLNA